MPAGCSSHSNSTPVASSTRRFASANSGPVPSPGISVTVCAMTSFSKLVQGAGDATARSLVTGPMTLTPACGRLAAPDCPRDLRALRHALYHDRDGEGARLGGALEDGRLLDDLAAPERLGGHGEQRRGAGLGDPARHRHLAAAAELRRQP